MRLRSLFLLGLLCVSLPGAELALAQALSKEVKLSGMGVRKCNEWLQWKEGRNNESRAMALEWAQGFIAGHNVYSRSGSGTPVSASVTVLIPLLDAYCQKNPDERILAGVIEITRELGGAKVDLTPRTVTPPAPAPRENKGRQDS